MLAMFGKKKKETKAPATQTILSEIENSAARLVERSSEIKLKLEKIELELKTALETFRNARTQPEKIKAKKKAVDILKKKKMYEAQLQNLDQVSNNVENVQMQVEVVKDNVSIMRTLKQTNDLQRDLMKEMHFEAIDDMIDEMQENKLLHEEFTDAVQKNYEVDVDESELDEELEKLDFEMKIELDKKELTVPDKKVITKKEQDEKNLNEFMVQK